MWDINEAHFRRIDLNALIVFMAVMRERSATRAAERLLVGQPAVSHALNNLRALFADQLFVRTGAGMVPTPRAEDIFARLAPALTEVFETVYGKRVFNPAVAERTIRLGLPDDLETIILPQLVRVLGLEAPNIKLVVRAADFRTIPRQLDDGDIDLAVSARPLTPASWHVVQTLRSDGFVCLYDPRMLKLATPIDMAQYLALPHVLVSANGELSGAIDQQLANLGHHRNVIMASARFSTLPLMLKSMKAIANMPGLPAAAYVKEHGLVTCPLPFDTPTFEVVLIRHAREAAEPALSFIAEHVARIVEAA
jgi:LysR family transcriptional regulator, mexEF-oprN operon transcriptional activator